MTEETREDRRNFMNGDHSSPHTLLTCPDCGGVLWEVTENGVLEYRCQIGHAYSQESLLNEQALTLEQALWTAVRSLEERAATGARMAKLSEERHMNLAAERFQAMYEEANQNAELIRGVLERGLSSESHIFNVADEPGGDQPPA